IEGHDASARTDIWSFGVVLYEMISGTHPFHGASLFLLGNSILRDQPRPLSPGTPAGLKTVISRCLEKEPERRYRRAGEVRAALKAVHLSPPPAPVAAPRKIAKSFQLRPALIVLFLIAIAAVAIVAVRRDSSGHEEKLSEPMPSRAVLGI